MEIPFSDAFSAKLDSIWQFFSQQIESHFPYLSKHNASLIAQYVYKWYPAEYISKLAIINPPLPLEILNPSDSLQITVPKYNYDMTYYINHPSQRVIDSQLMAKVFDQQWHIFKTTSHPDDNYPDVTFGDAFHGVRRCLQFLKDPYQIFSYYFKMIKIQAPTCISQLLNTSLQIVVPFFSHFKSFIHTHIDSLPPISYCYSELDTIAGYPLESHRALTDDPVAWLSQDVNDKHSPTWWANSIATVLLSSARRNDEVLLNFLDFLDSPWLWTTDGASNNSKLMLGKDRVKTKFGAALSLSKEELFTCVLHAINPKTTNIDIFIKPDERGFKRRLIANMDLGSYLVAAYIRYLIEFMDGPVPQWMTATTSPDLDLQVIGFLRQNKRSIPLDESQFDHHLSRNAWLGFLRALDFCFPCNIGVHLFHAMFANSSFFDRSTRKRGYWFKGMPSGLAITALGNTLFNYVKQQALLSPIHFGLGDDVLIFSEKYTLDELKSYYDTFGAEINTKKNWTSRAYAEYLHFMYCKSGRVGIPARMYGSIIYGLQFKDVSPLQRINELTTMFKDFYDRACLPMDQDLVAADLSRSVSARWIGFSKAVAKRWLHIPKALNGFGLYPYNFENFHVINIDTQRKFYHNSRLNLPPVVEHTKTDFFITPAKFRPVTFKLGNTYHPPPITSWDDWQLRLMNEFPDLPKAVSPYALSTIPLPELDYVSSSRMSSFASMWKYNAYPNAFGGPLVRTSRFISASLALVQQVVDWMRTNSIHVYV